MILSNQVRCVKCNDKPYSANRHDFQTCKCGSISVDGGMAYLRRSGDLNQYEDISIEIPDEAAKAAMEAIQATRMFEHGTLVESTILSDTLQVLKEHNIEMVTEFPTVIWEKVYQATYDAIAYAIETRRNSLGILCAIVRTYRDEAGVKFVLKETI